MPLGTQVPDDEVVHIARRSLEDSLARADEAQAEASARLLLHASSYSLEALYSQVVQYVLEDVGHGWARGTVSVAREHATTSTARGLVARLRTLPSARPRLDRRIVLLPARGEAHVLGLAMAEHVLLEAGWLVSLLDPLPPDELVHFVRESEDVALVGWTMHGPSLAQALRQDISVVRKDLPGLPLVIGGRAAREDPALAARVGADTAVVDLVTLVQLVRTLTNPLSPREREVLLQVSLGRTNREVADELGIRASAVKYHLEAVYAKTGVADRAGSVGVALRRGWLE